MLPSKRRLLELASPGGPPAAAAWEDPCLAIMDQLLASPAAWPLRQAAASAADSLEGVRARLQEGGYGGPLEWAADVRRLLLAAQPPPPPATDRGDVDGETAEEGEEEGDGEGEGDEEAEGVRYSDK